MPSKGVNLKSLIDLHISVLEESGTLFGVSTSRDVKTITTRIEHEGLSFLTITLPKFGKDLQRALADQKVASNHFSGFPRDGALPRFMQGWTKRVFDAESGVILDNPDVGAIRVIFQVTGLLKKVEFECTEKRTQAAFDKYVEIEAQIRSLEMEALEDREFLMDFRVFTHLLFGDLLHSWQTLFVNGEITPKHGPGATADRLRGNAKWDQPAWPDRLEEAFPFGRYAYTSWRHYLNDLDDNGRSASPGTEMPVRVIAVPKTLETPRIIAIEPTAMQYAQQGLMAAFEKCVRTSKYGSMVDYKSQLPNQEMAREGSITGFLATLDLSEASDRVSNQLVRIMLHDYPDLLLAVDATRSRSADVRGHGVIRLAKFASMGSALCFPIESMIFAIISMIGVYRGVKSSKGQFDTVSRVNVVKRWHAEVRTYGDDIIVPSKYAPFVVSSLEAFGLKVNTAKSFWTGMFRESCGKEYYNGIDVTHAKARTDLPSYEQPSSVRIASIVSTVSLRNHLFGYGYYETCEKLDSLLMVHLKGHYPRVGSDSPALGRHSIYGFDTQKMDDSLQIPLVKAYVVKSEIPKSKLENYGALMKTIGSDSEMNPDPRHLDRAGRPSVLRMQLKWVRAY